MGVQINPVVELAAAFADEGQSHAIEEAQAAANIGGGFAAGEVTSRHGGRRKFSDGTGRCRHRPRWFREVERQLSRRRGEILSDARNVRWHDIFC